MAGHLSTLGALLRQGPAGRPCSGCWPREDWCGAARRGSSVCPRGSTPGCRIASPSQLFMGAVGRLPSLRPPQTPGVSLQEQGPCLEGFRDRPGPGSHHHAGLSHLPGLSDDAPMKSRTHGVGALLSRGPGMPPSGPGSCPVSALSTVTVESRPPEALGSAGRAPEGAPAASVGWHCPGGLLVLGMCRTQGAVGAGRTR